MADGGPVYEAIRTRRVSRHMDARPLHREDVERVVRAAGYAPNAGNRRLQPVVAVTEARTLELLRKVSPGMLAKPRAAAVICIDHGRAEGYGFAPRAPGLFVDVGTAAATMLLAAHELGLGSCPVTSFSRAAAARLLGLADGIEPWMVICLGYPAEEQPPPMGAWAGAPIPGRSG